MTLILLFILLLVLAIPNIEINQWKIIKTTSFTILMSIILTINIFNFSSEFKINIFNSLFYINSLLQFIIIFIFIISIFLILPWSNFFNFKIELLTNKKFIFNNFKTYTINPSISEFSLIIIFTVLGINFLILSNSLISLFLSIELQSFGVYILATLYRHSETSTSAGLKYYLLGGLSTCLILLGSALIYNNLGTLNFSDIFINFSIDFKVLNLSKIGFIILISGLIFKIAAAPLHNWAPDVYAGVPTIITTWLAIIPKISIFIILLNFSLNFYFINDFIITENTFDNLNNFNFFILLILFFSILSIIIGSILGLSQNNIKKLLTYSTILNIGFILISLSVNNLDSLVYFIFYLIQYSITSIVIFFLLLGISYFIHKNIFKNNFKFVSEKNFKNPNMFLRNFKITNSNFDINIIYEIVGLNIKYPIIIFTITVCIFSLAGIPPFIGFFAKIGVLISVLDSGYYFLTILGVIFSVISSYYYLRIVKLIQFDNLQINQIYFNFKKSLRVKFFHFKNYKNLTKDNFNIQENDENDLILTNTHSFLISFFSIILILFWIKPNLILDTLNMLALNFYNF